MADFSQIIQEINTNLPDNNTQSITAAKLRTTLIDLTNTIDTVQDDFETEVNEYISDLVIDNLSSTSTTNALSANQGRILNETIDDVSHSVSDLTNTVSNINNSVDNLKSTVNYENKPINIISNVGKSNISIFDGAIKSSTLIANQNNDTISPFKGILEKYTEIIAPANTFVEEAHDSRNNLTATKLTMSLWVNENEYSDWTTDGYSYFDLKCHTWHGGSSGSTYTEKTLRLYIKNALNTAIGGSASLAGNYWTHIEKIGNWHHLMFYKTITPDFTTYSYRFVFQKAGTYSIVNPQIIESGTIPEGIVVIKDETNGVIPYPADNYTTSIKMNQLISVSDEVEPLIPQITEALPKVNEIKYKFGIDPNRNWDDCAIGIGKYSNSYYVRAKGLGNNFDYVISYNIIPTAMIYKIAKSSSSIVSITIDNRMISTDDDCPINFDGTYQGGNHGWSFMTVLTMSENSGISNLNIGQVWKDANNNLYLVVAINTTQNTVSVLGINAYTGTLTYPYFNNTAPVSPFTVVNPTGSSETYSFVSKTGSNQQFNKIKNKIDKSCWIDGIKITTDMLQNVSGSKTTWLCGDKYEYKHTYSLIKPNSFIEYLTQNVGTLENNYSVEDVDISMTLDETYTFGYGGGLSIKSVVSSCDNELINFSWGQTQQGAGFGGSVSANEQIIIPNHSTYYTPTNTPSTGVNITYSNAINENLPFTRFYRFNDVQSSFTKGLCEGYNDTYGTGTIEQKKLQSSLARLETTKKWYPKATGGNLENNNLPPYSVVASFAYKGGLDNYPLNPFFYWFDDDTAYLLIESHSAQTSTIKLPESLIGWNVSIETEFGDVEIKSKNVGKYGLKISTGSYGSAVIKITK